MGHGAWSVLRLATVLTLAAAAPAAANAYLPIQAVTTSVFLVAFLPVCALEAAWYWRRLGAAQPRALLASCAANLLSSVLGVPLSWVSLEVVGRVLDPGGAFEASGYVLHDARIDDPARHLLYMAVCVAPAFWVSLQSERWAVGRLVPSAGAEEVSKAVWEANVASYALLYLALFLLPAFGLPALADILSARGR